MNRLCVLLLSILCLRPCLLSAQPIYGLFGLDDPNLSHRQLGTLGTDGTIGLLGTATSLDSGTISLATGLTAYNKGGNLVYFVGRTDSDSTSKLFSVSTADGSATTQNLSYGTWNTIDGIEYDEPDDRLVGLFRASSNSNDRQLGVINTTDGTVTLLGSAIASNTLFTNPGVVAGNNGSDLIYFLGQPSGGSGSLYSVNTTTGIATAQVLSGAAYNNIVGMEYDEAEGVLYALVFVGSERQLATIDPGTGVVTFIGASTLGGGGVAIATIQGLTTLDAEGDEFFFAGRVSGSWTIFAVNTGNGSASSSAITETAIRSGQYFGLEFNVADTDYGDAPDPSYPTLLASDGARHAIVTGFYLGASVDAEVDGQSTVAAEGDDTSGVADEDGVTANVTSNWTPGSTQSFTVVSSGAGELGIWLDWNNDGDFNDTGEYVTASVVAGSNTLNVTVPQGTGDDFDWQSDELYARFRLFSSGASAPGGSLDAADYQGAATDGEVEDYVWGVLTLPVSLSSVDSRLIDSGLEVDWTTATETANIGFHLYAEVNGQMHRLNDDLIPSHVVDAVTPQDYRYTVTGISADTFWLADIDTQGHETLHGPYELGQSHGRPTELDPIAWASIKAEHKAKKDKRKNPKSRGQFSLLVEHNGVYRVSHEQLLALDYDLKGVKGRDIALFNQGVSIPIRVYTTGNGAKFDAGSHIEFVGEGIESLYSKHNVYVISVDKANAERAANVSAEPAAGVAPEPYYMATTEVANQNQYSFASPNGDPWYDDRLLAYKAPISHDYSVPIDHVVAGSASSLDVQLWGVTNFPESPDHHVVIEFNGVEIADRQFDGLVDYPVSVSLANGILQNGINTLTLSLPHDTGVLYDLVNLEGFSIQYPRAFVADADALVFSASGEVFEVIGLSNAEVVVYRQHSNGVIESLEDVEVYTSNGNYSARFAGSSSTATYHVVTESALLTPGLEPVLAEPLEVTDARYHIIAHADFIGDDLDRLVNVREAEGYSVQVVDVAALYATYSHHITDPLAIQAYLTDIYAEGAKYVLLVGGDTYDYHDYLGQDAVSFIPSLYAQTDSLIRYAPVDALYTDVNGDQIPDMAIGRFPVRSSAELATMIDQTLAYGSNTYSRTAVFAADAYDEAQGYSFANDSEGIINRLPFDWQVERAYVDDLGVNGAKSTLLDSVNQGVALTGFFGHSGPTVWTFSGLLNSTDIADLSNAGKPTVVTQWGCWNTYFVSPSANTLGHNFMLSGDRGAAAVLGASTLTEASAEEELAQLLFDELLKPSMTLGEAIRVAKQNYALDKPDQLDVILGWTLLGDPTLVIEP